MAADLAPSRPAPRAAAAPDYAWAARMGAWPAPAVLPTPRNPEATWRRAEPPRYKRAVVGALAVFPVLTALQATFGAAIADWPLTLRTLAVTAIVAPTLTYVTLPLTTRLLAAWLRPSPSSRTHLVPGSRRCK